MSSDFKLVTSIFFISVRTKIKKSFFNYDYSKKFINGSVLKIFIIIILKRFQRSHEDFWNVFKIWKFFNNDYPEIFINSFLQNVQNVSQSFLKVVLKFMLKIWNCFDNDYSNIFINSFVFKMFCLQLFLKAISGFLK